MSSLNSILVVIALLGLVGKGTCSAGTETSLPSGDIEKRTAVFQFASGEAGIPSISLQSLGLKAIRTDAVFVVHASSNAALAAEIARTLEAMNRASREIVGSALRLHGLVLVEDARDLPQVLRGHNWVNVDGISCLVQQVKGKSLPLRDGFSNYMIFPLLAHENADDGIKAECLGGRLTDHSQLKRTRASASSKCLAPLASAPGRMI